MAGLVEKPVETFIFGVADGWHNESDYARIVADAFRTAHHPLGGNCDDPGLLEEVTWFMDEPLGDAAVLPTYMLSKLTREFVTVALTGEGADELLGGYDKYKALAKGDALSRFLPRPLFGLAAHLLPVRSKAYRACRFMGAAKDRARAYIELVSVFCDAEKRRLLAPGTIARLRGVEPSSAVIRRILDGCPGDDYLDHVMHIDVGTWLPNDVLLKADKMTMAHALEGRVPFLDHPFAEFCARIPGRLKMKGWREKHLMREAMRGLVPEQIIDRRKHGFTVPMEAWTEGGAKSPIARYLSRDAVKRRGWFDPAAVESLLQADLKSEYTRRQVFALLALEAWARTFLDADTLEAPERDPIARTAAARTAS
jgi:asparagine synthase (glutamine-hydrolysing)